MDNSGSVNCAEVKSILINRGVGEDVATDAQLAVWIKEADEDGTGEVEWREFLTLWAKVRRPDPAIYGPDDYH